VSWLQRLKVCPFVLEGFQVDRSCAFYRLILKLIELAFRPETSYVALFRKTVDHLKPRVSFIFLVQQKQRVNNNYSVFPRVFLAVKKFVLVNISQLWLLCSLSRRKDKVFRNSSKDLTSTDWLLYCHTDERQPVFKMKERYIELWIKSGAILSQSL
jgi:hypothetical protein